MGNTESISDRELEKYCRDGLTMYEVKALSKQFMEMNPNSQGIIEVEDFYNSKQYKYQQQILNIHSLRNKVTMNFDTYYQIMAPSLQQIKMQCKGIDTENTDTFNCTGCPETTDVKR